MLLPLTRLGELPARCGCAAIAPARGETGLRGERFQISDFRFQIDRNLTYLLFVLVALLVSPAAAEVQLPEPSLAEPITIAAQAGNQWQLGAYEVWVLRGNCVIQQGQGYARCREAVLWIHRAEAAQRQPDKVIAYLEGDVEVMQSGEKMGTGSEPTRANPGQPLSREVPVPIFSPGAARLTDQTWLGRFFSSAGVQVRAAQAAGKPDALPPIYWRGMERRSGRIRRKRLAVPRRAGAIHAAGGGCHCWLVQQCREHGWASQPWHPRVTRSGARNRAGSCRFAGVAGRAARCGTSGARSRGAANSRLSPQRRARPISVVSIRPE